MRRALLVLAVIAAGCSTTDKEEAAREREKSKEDIRRMLEEVIAAMRDNKPEIYHAKLCRAERAAYPLDEMRQDWNESRAKLSEVAASMTVKTVAPDMNDPNVATFLVTAPGDPRGTIMRDAIREDGEWRIRNFFDK